MVQAGEIGIEPETIINLPIETLAFAVLENFHLTDSWSRHNWMLGAKRECDGDYIVALSEAWAWLESRGLLVQDYSKSAECARVVSRSGKKVIESGSFDKVIAAERIGMDLHSTLAGKVRPIFMLGDFEVAAFAAMKEVEVRVRDMASLSQDFIGVKLMREAFGPKKPGPLVNVLHEAGEQQARADFFAGAIGSFKNPTSHRVVTYSNPTEASEVILLADLLMRILDSVERELVTSLPT